MINVSAGPPQNVMMTSWHYKLLQAQVSSIVVVYHIFIRLAGERLCGKSINLNVSAITENCTQRHPERDSLSVRRDEDSMSLRPGVLNLPHTWGHTHPALMTRGPQCYKWGQFIETPWQFIKMVTTLRLLLQTGSHIIQSFTLTKTITKRLHGATSQKTVIFIT
jgi:hypothetical protein